MPRRSIRFRPNFSLRTLAIFVTLVCLYFGAWEVTKKYGVKRGSLPAGSPMPFIVWKEQFDGMKKGQTTITVLKKDYSLWLFGFGLRLFEADVKPYIMPKMSIKIDARIDSKRITRNPSAQ